MQQERGPICRGGKSLGKKAIAPSVKNHFWVGPLNIKAATILVSINGQTITKKTFKGHSFLFIAKDLATTENDVRNIENTFQN